LTNWLNATIFTNWEKIEIKVCVNNKLSLTIPNFSPEEAQYPWDDIFIVPFKDLKNGSYEEVKEGQEDFWSVCLHQVNGDFGCIADLPNKNDAFNLQQLIIKVIQNKIS
jgi:hypothetical protein